MLETINIELFEKFDYSFEKLVNQRRICGFAIVSPRDSFRVISGFMPRTVEFPLEEMSENDKVEIISHLSSFDDKLLLCEIGEKLCAFLPSLYPSSSLCLAIIFDREQFTASQLLRLTDCNECPNIFALSRSVKSGKARMTDTLMKSGESFFELCRQLSDSLVSLGDPLRYGENENCETLATRVLDLSMLIGCPIDSLSFDEKVTVSSLFDLPLFLSFVATFMLFALNSSPSRSLAISLYDVSGELVVKISFDCEKDTLSLPFVEWEAIAADKNMFFEVYEENGRSYVSFQPTRRDWSYLGLKQNTKFI